MNKPITMIIKETKKNLINVCNESGLSPAILDLIVQGLYSEVHSLADKQSIEEEMAYARAIEESLKETVPKDSEADLKG